jgi:hypothetical protein
MELSSILGQLDEPSSSCLSSSSYGLDEVGWPWNHNNDDVVSYRGGDDD